MPGKIFKEKEKKNPDDSLKGIWKYIQSFFHLALLSSPPVESLEMAFSLLISLVSCLQGHWSTRHPRSLQPQLGGPRLEPRLLASHWLPGLLWSLWLIQFWPSSSHLPVILPVLDSFPHSAEAQHLVHSTGVGAPVRNSCRLAGGPDGLGAGTQTRLAGTTTVALFPN